MIINGRRAVICQHCKWVFPSSTHFSNSTSITFKNVMEICWKCRKSTPAIEDGTYDFDETGNPQVKQLANLILNYGYNDQVISKLYELSQSAKKHPISKKTFTNRLGAIAPGLDFVFENYFKDHQYTIAFIAVLIAALALIQSFRKKSPEPVTQAPVVINNYNTYQSYPVPALATTQSLPGNNAPKPIPNASVKIKRSKSKRTRRSE